VLVHSSNQPSSLYHVCTTLRPAEHCLSEARAQQVDGWGEGAGVTQPHRPAQISGRGGGGGGGSAGNNSLALSTVVSCQCRSILPSLSLFLKRLGMVVRTEGDVQDGGEQERWGAERRSGER
jgi:hypothetical protein